MRHHNKTFTQQHRPKKNLLIAGIASVIDAMKTGEATRKNLFAKYIFPHRKQKN